MISTTARRSPLFSWYGELSIFISQGKKISSEDEDAEFYLKSLKNVIWNRRRTIHKLILKWKKASIV